MRLVRWIAAFLCALSGYMPGPGRIQIAEAQPAHRDPLIVRSADPMELSRVVQRLGDGEVLARMAAGQPAELRLAAIRATPWMQAPELALEDLAVAASGRDPDLAPAAAWAFWQICRSLTAADLVRREADLGAVRRGARQLQRLARDPTVRADIQRLAALSSLELEGL